MSSASHTQYKNTVALINTSPNSRDMYNDIRRDKKTRASKDNFPFPTQPYNQPQGRLHNSLTQHT